MKLQTNAVDIGLLFLERCSLSNTDEPALVLINKNFNPMVFTWKDFKHHAVLRAITLKNMGVKSGDIVATIPINLPEAFCTMWGIILAGAVPVPMHAQLLKEKDQSTIKKVICDCQPKFVLINDWLSPYVEDIKHQVLTIKDLVFLERDVDQEETEKMANIFMEERKESGEYSQELLIMPYTSGTSGNPKGVMLTHSNVLDRLEAISNALEITSQERIFSYLPLAHISELIATFFGQAYRGYTVYFSESITDTIENRKSLKNSFAALLQLIEPTIFLAVPKIWENFRKEIQWKLDYSLLSKFIPHSLKKKLITKKLGFTKTRIFISAGSQLSNMDKEFFKKILNIDILDIYGQTETAGPLTIDGKAIGNVLVKISSKGNIVVTGDCVMAGYYKHDHSAFEKDTNKITFYNTGDTGCLQNEKIIWTGRNSDGFKLSNGEYVSPQQIEILENKIRAIDDNIINVMIYGLNKPYLTALIFYENFPPEKNLIKNIEKHLPHVGQGMYKLKNYFLIESKNLELTPTMKIKRNETLKKLSSTIEKLYEEEIVKK